MLSADGRPIQDYDVSYLRSQMAVVLQDVFLFSGTVMDNIRLRSDIPEQKAIQAARFVSADFVEALPGGYQAEVTVTAGSTRLQGWRVSWTLGSDQVVRTAFNGVLTADGSTMTVRNETWNGTLAAGASTTFGYVLDGGPTPPVLSCVAE